MPSTPRRVGVLGGTFDPPHIGHLVAAVNARHDLDLDVVLLVVAGEPWQKVGTRDITSAADRLAMAQAAVEGTPGVEVSDIEVRRAGPSYTVETLEALRAEDPGAELFLIVGSDVAADLDSWERVDEIRSLTSLVVVTRPGAEPPALPGWRSIVLTIPALDISSTELRARAAQGRPLDHLVPAGAFRCLRERGLYAGR